MPSDTSSSIASEYHIDPSVIVIFKDLRQNFVFNLVILGLVGVKVYGDSLAEEFVYAIAWNLVGIACLQRIFYFFLDHFFFWIMVCAVVSNFQSSSYGYAFGWLMLEWIWLGRLVKITYPKFAKRLKRVQADPWEWSESD